jgi:hypothetical protein
MTIGGWGRVQVRRNVASLASPCERRPRHNLDITSLRFDYKINMRWSEMPQIVDVQFRLFRADPKVRQYGEAAT